LTRFSQMLPIQQFSSGVLAEIIRRQPPSKERTTFAWQIAVGPAIARTTTVEIVEGVLQVFPRDARWGHEVSRAVATILPRMQHLLGPQAVRSLRVVKGQ
jgi:predicted nucleic acid-binding Zn ribbon protein